jgi:hypothetical protein
MTDISKITKEQFDAVYNKHLPSNWTKFAFKYFSRNTEQKDMSVKNGVIYILGGLFVFGLLGTMFNVSKALIKAALIPYTIILVALVLYLFSAVILNNIRIGKIKKEFNINTDEYNALISKFIS